MISEYLSSFVDNIREKAKNPFSQKNSTPFAGAFLIAFIIYNWQLFFTLFNFEDSCSREDKIQIISDYLDATSWTSRIGIPLIIAFCSIVFYYVFNNISLGVTIFFNRWFRATVLYFMDSSKIITREELDANILKMSYIQEKHEDLKKLFAESESHINTLKNKIAENEGSWIKLRSESEKKDLELSSLKEKINTENALEVVYAEFGFNSSYSDVTEVIKERFAKEKRFSVDVKLLGDPLPNVVKDLFIIYRVEGQILRETTIEGSIVELRGNKLDVKIEKEAISKTAKRHAFEQLLSVISGAWELTSSKGNSSSKENIYIDDFGRYFIEGVHVFNIRNPNLKDEHIKFEKLSLNNEIQSTEDLVVANEQKISGRDSNGSRLFYSRKIFIA